MKGMYGRDGKRSMVGVGSNGGSRVGVGMDRDREVNRGW